jgi:hypothetical protein
VRGIGLGLASYARCPALARSCTRVDGPELQNLFVGHPSLLIGVAATLPATVGTSANSPRGGEHLDEFARDMEPLATSLSFASAAATRCGGGFRRSPGGPRELAVSALGQPLLTKRGSGKGGGRNARSGITDEGLSDQLD